MIKPPKQRHTKYIATGGDVLPANPPQDSELYMFDSGLRYKYKGDAWVQTTDFDDIRDCITQLSCLGMPAKIITHLEEWVEKEEASGGGLTQDAQCELERRLEWKNGL